MGTTRVISHLLAKTQGWGHLSSGHGQNAPSGVSGAGPPFLRAMRVTLMPHPAQEAVYRPGEDDPQALRHEEARFARFWASLEPVTPFFSLPSLTRNRSVHPTSVLVLLLYFGNTQPVCFHKFTAGEEFSLGVNHAWSLTTSDGDDADKRLWTETYS